MELADKSKCKSSQDGQHSCDIGTYAKDDFGIYLDCTLCGETLLFEGYESLRELMPELYDDED